jgi:probable phosphoglycerate mutase
VVPVPGFRETNNGRLAGMRKAEAREKYPGIFFAALDFDEPYPGGESPRAFRDRIEAAWAEFRRNTEGLRGDTLLVTHAGVINVILCHESGIPFTNREMTWPTPHAGIVAVESTGSAALTS